MADELSYPRRFWRPQDLKSLELKGFQSILTQRKGRCFHSIVDKSIGCAITYFLGKPKDGSDASLLWLQLEYLSCLPLDLNLDINSSIPSWVPLQNLQCLRIDNGCFQKLWQSDVQAPSHLEELQIRDTFVEEFPDLLGKLNNMKKLDLHKCIQTDIFECPVLEEVSCLDKLSCLEQVKIDSSEKIQHIILPTSFIELDVRSCRVLQRVVVAGDLTELRRLAIGQCPALEELPSFAGATNLEKIEIDSCEKIQHIILPKSLIELDVQSCRVLQRVAVAGDLTELKRLVIGECPALEELPGFAGVNCLEEIEITLPTSLIRLSVKGCGVLQRIEGLADVTELKQLCIADCPELELPCLGRLICLQRIVIDSCENPQIISAIEELHVPGYAALTFCSSAVTRYFIDRWKSLPECTYLIGKALDGADSSLNEHLFSDANIAIDGVTEISTGNLYYDWSGLGAVIVYFAIVINSSTLAENVNANISYLESHFKMRQGEFIIAIYIFVTDHFFHYHILYLLKRYGIVKKGYRVALKEGEEWKSHGMLATIVDRLFDRE